MQNAFRQNLSEDLERKTGADGTLLHPTFAPHFRFGELEYSRTDASGEKKLTKEQYESEIRIGKEVKRQQTISLADIEGRILDEAGNIDPKKLKAYFNELQSQGVQIMTGKNAEALLKKHNANALYLPGDTPGQPGMIVLREGAEKHHIIEEIFHLKQHEQEGFRNVSVSDIIDMELEAHDQMLDYAKTKGWTQKEIDQLERNRASWEGDKKRYSDPNEKQFRADFNEKQSVFKNKNENEWNRYDSGYFSHSKNDGKEALTITDENYKYHYFERNENGDWCEKINGKLVANGPNQGLIDKLPEKYKEKPELKPAELPVNTTNTTNPVPAVQTAEDILTSKLNHIKNNPADYNVNYDVLVQNLNQLDAAALKNLDGCNADSLIAVSNIIGETGDADIVSLFLKSKGYDYNNTTISTNLRKDVLSYKNRVRERNPDLYNLEKPLNKPEGMEVFSNVKNDDNGKSITTDVYQNDNKGNFTRTYSDGHLSLEGSALNYHSKGSIDNFVHDKPNLLNETNTNKTKKGTPTVVWITLMQMQALNIKPGSLKQMSLSNVMNIDSVLQFSWLMKNNAPDIGN
ncbi:MAG: hypothetical protein ACRC3B_12125, partial [Bacteroidia bacterium]